MGEFSKALIYPGKSGKIPKEYNWFDFLAGEWDIHYSDNHGTGQERHVRGEWIFSWVLDGTAIQDVFICPSRAERRVHSQPDATWGTTLLIFSPGTKAWDIFYGTTGEADRFEAKKEGGQIVLTEITESKMKWIFPDIRNDYFLWENRLFNDGGTSLLQCRTGSTRRKRSCPFI